MKKDFYELYIKKIEQRGGLANYARHKSMGPVGMMVKRIKKVFSAGGRVLEVGTGTGVLAALLAKQGFSITAVDYDERMVELSKECCLALGVSVEVLQMDMFNLSNYFKCGDFDSVISHGVMEHYEDDKIISALIQQLEIANSSIFCVPGNAMSEEYKKRGDGSERYLTPKEWRRILMKGNFTCDAVFGAGFGKYCRSRFIPNCLSRNHAAGKILASKAAFIEIWIHNRNKMGVV